MAARGGASAADNRKYEESTFLGKTVERLAAQQEQLQKMMIHMMERLECQDKWKRGFCNSH